MDAAITGELAMGLIRAQRAIPEFAFSALPSGVGRLDPYLTINSTTVAPSLRYKCGDANGTNLVPWQWGATLALQAGTAPSYNQGSVLNGLCDDSALFNGGGYYLCGDTTTGNVSTDDIVVELVFKLKKAFRLPDGTFAAKRSTGVGWQLFANISGELSFTLVDEDGSITTASSALDTYDDTWYHAMAFADRSGSCQIYINGLADGAAVDISATEKTLDAAVAFAFGADSVGTAETLLYSSVAYFAMWHSAAWLDTHLQTTVAASRFAALTGSYLNLADGTALPTTTTRACCGYLTKYNIATGYSKLYLVGSGWLRQESYEFGSGAYRYGYLAEQAAENLIPESEDFETTWVALDAGDIIDTGIAGPDGRLAASGLIADATDGQHGLVVSVGNLRVETHTHSVFAKPGNKNWILLYDFNTTCGCYFNVATGAIGTVAGTLVDQRITGPYFGGFYRCEISFTGTTAEHAVLVQSADADGNEEFAGDGATVNTYIWGAQCELGEKATSPIISVGGGTTRQADVLNFNYDNFSLGPDDECRIEFEVKFASAATLESDVTLLSIGGVATW